MAGMGAKAIGSEIDERWRGEEVDSIHIYVLVGRLWEAKT